MDVWHCPHTSPVSANLALRAICLPASWWGYNYIAVSRLLGNIGLRAVECRGVTGLDCIGLLSGGSYLPQANRPLSLEEAMKS